MQPEETTRAACLTPAGAGGIAVVQVIGLRAAEVLRPHLAADRPLDLESLVPDRLRLCRIVEGDTIIDDAVVVARRDDLGRLVLDVNVHGGPRVVQRVLLLLKRAGVEIVDARELLRVRCEGRPAFEREAAEALLLVKTRPVAAWLARTLERLPAVIDEMLADLSAGRVAEVRDRLAEQCVEGGRARYLLGGVRVVLVGRPNTGKSTLANRLAGRDLAIVSDQPGTTRDWTEHPGAISGIPFTFVDTAGIRLTGDPIEREAIRRSHAQVAPADVAVRVIDGSQPPHDDDLSAMEPAEPISQPVLFVWNKADLGTHPEQTRLIGLVREREVTPGAHRRTLKTDRLEAGPTTDRLEAGPTADRPEAGPIGVLGRTLSAATGEGLDDLRGRLVGLLGLEGWETADAAPFTERQLAAYQSALSALEGTPLDAVFAARRLKSVTSLEPPQEDR